MAKKKNDIVGRARTRKPAPVKKPFPVGFAIGSLALALALGSILFYAATHQGLGDKHSLTYAEAHVDGLHKNHHLSAKHKEGVIPYPGEASIPPDGGNHNGLPQSCLVYDKPIANEHAVHSLEHGAVWITYNPSLPKADVDKLKALVNGDQSRMLSPYPGLKSKISLQAWGEQLFVDKVSDKRITTFLDLFTAGPQTPEKSKACQGTTATGPIAAVTPTPAPKPSASASASASASPAPTPSSSPSK